MIGFRFRTRGAREWLWLVSAWLDSAAGICRGQTNKSGGVAFLGAGAHALPTHLEHFCSSPASHLSHSRHASTRQPTPTWSPTLNFETLLPTASTMPTSSCPGTTGYSTERPTPAMWLAAVCKSEWQTPQYIMSMSTSVSESGLRWSLIGLKWHVASSQAMHSVSMGGCTAVDSYMSSGNVQRRRGGWVRGWSAGVVECDRTSADGDRRVSAIAV